MQGFVASRALRNAIAVHRQPLLARRMEQTHLPDGLIDVLRVAAEGKERALSFSDELGASVSEVHDACLFYLQAVVFHQDASDARLLALTEPFNPEVFRDHKRLILKWLHPDRNHNNWENKLFNRVLSAAKRLERSMVQAELPQKVPDRSSAASGRLIRSLETNQSLQGKPLDTSSVPRGSVVKITFAIIFLTMCVGLLLIAIGGHSLSFIFEAMN